MESELQISGINHIVFRVANVYGPFQKHGRGQGVLAEWLNCFNNNAPLLVFGSENNYRDYINVLDVCGGIESVLNIDFSDTFNLGSGVATSIGDLLKIFKDCAGKELEVIKHSSREYDRNGFFLDMRKLQKLTNWEPTVDLATGISLLFKTEKESNDLEA
jgi:UDP-glucose 4-epimerase